MTAEEMFKELGYEKFIEENRILYVNYCSSSGYRQDICFDLDDKTISSEFMNDYGSVTDYDFDCETLPAIIKQAKELGWYKVPNDEKKDYYTNKDKLEIEEKKLKLDERKVIAFEKIAESLNEFNKIFENKYFI